MIMCLDIGNSQIFGGIFDGDRLKIQFRRTSQVHSSSDELGVFFRGVLRENGVDPDEITQIVLCCVVPDLMYSLRSCCQKYFGVEPLVLRPGSKTGLKIRYRDPRQVGADRIADALGAIKLFPDQNLIVVDFGTATTLCAISKDKEFLGGNIVPGIRLSMEALEAGTAQLPPVEILRPDEVLGRSTVESIQAGLYWANVGMIRELVNQVTRDVFRGERPRLIGTGGFSHLFDREDIFDEVVPDLILMGLREVIRLNA